MHDTKETSAPDGAQHAALNAARARYAGVIIGLLIALAAFTVWNINTGSVHISVPDIARILFLKAGDSTQVGIVWNLRLPRICAAAILGGGLALSGFLMQTFFGNPIAGPSCWASHRAPSSSSRL